MQDQPRLVPMTLRERRTTVKALRVYQQFPYKRRAELETEEQEAPLDDDEIDALCERVESM
jgi:hypothetical protein